MILVVLGFQRGVQNCRQFEFARARCDCWSRSHGRRNHSRLRRGWSPWGVRCLAHADVAHPAQGLHPGQLHWCEVSSWDRSCRARQNLRSCNGAVPNSSLTLSGLPRAFPRLVHIDLRPLRHKLYSSGQNTDRGQLGFCRIHLDSTAGPALRVGLGVEPLACWCAAGVLVRRLVDLDAAALAVTDACLSRVCRQLLKAKETKRPFLMKRSARPVSLTHAATDGPGGRWGRLGHLIWPQRYPTTQAIATSWSICLPPVARSKCHTFEPKWHQVEMPSTTSGAMPKRQLRNVFIYKCFVCIEIEMFNPTGPLWTPRSCKASGRLDMTCASRIGQLQLWPRKVT